MDSTWTAMIVFYSLLFSVALLLFTCLCILCKRKKRKTQDVTRILAAAAATNVTGSRLHLAGRDRSGAVACCGGVETSSDDGPSVERQDHPPLVSNIVVGQINVVFEGDNLGLPPDYEEALKSKYAKVCHVYPVLERGRASLTSVVSTASTSAYQEEPPVEIRSISGESPPPPYDVAVRHIDAAGHFS